MNQVALSMSLCNSSMMRLFQTGQVSVTLTGCIWGEEQYSWRKLLLMRTNQYEAARTEATLREPPTSDVILRAKSWSLSRWWGLGLSILLGDILVAFVVSLKDTRMTIYGSLVSSVID
jgi:hypothetical protein